MKRCLRPGCKKPAKREYCSDRCRAATHKLRKRMGDALLPRERKRMLDAAAKREARAQGAIASDMRLSYVKAVQVLAGHFEGRGMLPEYALERAEQVLSQALPESKRPVAP